MGETDTHAIVITQAETYRELQVRRIHQWQGSYNFLQFKNNSTIIDHLLYIRLLNLSGGKNESDVLASRNFQSKASAHKQPISLSHTQDATDTE